VICFKDAQFAIITESHFVILEGQTTLKISVRENFDRIMTGGKAHWVPLDITATRPVLDSVERQLGNRNLTKVFGLDIENVCTFDDLNNAAQIDVSKWQKAYSEMGVALPERNEMGFAGLVFAVPSAESIGEAYHLRELFHPLSSIKTVKELENLPWPQFTDAQLNRTIAARIEAAHSSDRVAAAWLECTVFEMSWYLRGMDNLFIDLMEGNGIGDWLLDWFMNHSIQTGIEYARAGVDVIGLGDDVGTQRGMMMSVDFWREHFKPRLKKVIDEIRKHQTNQLYIRYHSDGDIRAIIDDLIEIGVDFLNPVQPECMPVGEVVRKYQNRIGFWGLIGTQSTMPFGTPDDVRKVISDGLRMVQDGASIVLAPTHVLEPDVPWANIQALTEADRSLRPQNRIRSISARSKMRLRPATEPV
jgi:uroporphyrinogen decarboxylase